MSDLSPSSTQPSGKRSYWKRPEGKVGMAILAGLGAVLGWGFIRVLPQLIQLAENTLYLAFLLGALALVYAMVFVWDRPRTLLFYGLQMISRWVTGNFVELDPVSILKSFVKQMKSGGRSSRTAWAAWWACGGCWRPRSPRARRSVSRRCAWPPPPRGRATTTG